ncbi:hypothetical protein DESPIG_01693, partial [Desulfovibrio piger ATCC 29098]
TPQPRKNFYPGADVGPRRCLTGQAAPLWRTRKTMTGRLVRGGLSLFCALGKGRGV